MNREMLQQAKVYDGRDLGEWFVSSKLDGFRAWWDGGVSRGVMKKDVPWANCEKDARYVVPQVATGLWTRYGNVIHAPDWWLDQLPEGIWLDGEMWGHMPRETLRSICARLVPEPSEPKAIGWEDVHLYVVARLDYRTVLAQGQIRNPNFTKYIGPEAILWAKARGAEGVSDSGAARMYKRLESLLGSEPTYRAIMLPQTQLRCLGWEFQLEELLAGEMAKTYGEGLIATAPDNLWTPRRIDRQLKVKPRQDAEGVVVGVIAGDRRMLGMVGALRVNWGGVIFDIGTGLSDKERALHGEVADWCYSNPGKLVPTGLAHQSHWVGQTITFKYRTLSEKGVPVESSFWRLAL